MYCVSPAGRGQIEKKWPGVREVGGAERERESASVRRRRRRGPRKREEMAMVALTLDSRRARECFAEEDLSSKEERRWRDREKSRW